MCSYCGEGPCDVRCPCYESEGNGMRCEFCGYGIEIGSWYVSLEDGCYHQDCVSGSGSRQLLECLGVEIERASRLCGQCGEEIVEDDWVVELQGLEYHLECIEDMRAVDLFGLLEISQEKSE